MIKRKNWEEFKDSGLLFFINQILHAFGYAIVFEFNTITGEIADVYPARVKFRGFGEKQVEEGYKKLNKYMMDNSREIYDESL